MSVKTNLTIKLDAEVRNEFSQLCDDIGISMAGALNALIRQSIRDKSMSFSLKDENGFTEQESMEVACRIKSIESGKSTLIERALLEVD